MHPDHAGALLRDILVENDVKRVLLVTGKRSFQLSGAAERVLPILNDLTHFSHFDDVPKNPDTEAVEAAARRCGSPRPDLIIAVGGGSAIDLAKALSVRLSAELPAAQCLEFDAWGHLELVPIMALPTTTGTGSEATQFAVVYHDNRKYSLSSPKLLPQHVLLVPSFTQAQPLSVRASAGFDALTQAIESYWSGHGTVESDRAALKAIELAAPCLKKGLHDFNDDIASKMQEASNLAGRAINQTRTTAPHALSYALTTDYGVDHGHAVGLMLPKVWRLHQRLHLSAKLPETLLERMQHVSVLLEKDVWEVPSALESMLTQNQLPYTFQSLGLERAEDWLTLCGRVNLERLRNHPVDLTKEDIEGLWTREIPHAEIADNP